MQMNRIRIGTRGSVLALWQANYVAMRLHETYPDLVVETVPIKTEGDRRQDVPLVQIGGKGLFVKELESALLDDRIDIAVHSMKDVTVNMPEDFCIPVILEREDPRDALVSNHYQSIEDLPQNATVGTCSPRRRSQLLSMRPDIQVKELRGNVPTRLKKLDDGQFDAIILAIAGLNRLGLQERITQRLNPEIFVPSPGQGAMGIECRANDSEMLELLEPLNHSTTFSCVSAERQVNRRLGGSCHSPMGVFACNSNNELKIRAWVGNLDGSDWILKHSGETADKESLAVDELVEKLSNAGALEILASAEPN